MTTVADARQVLASAVTAAGLETLPYPPDNPSPPIAFVDDVAVDFTGGTGSGAYFCLPGSALATVVQIAQRNDRPGAMAYLEGLMPSVLVALNEIEGLRVMAAQSGQLNVGGQDLPAVTYTVSFLA